MNGKMIGTKPLYVALAQRKDVRRQALESQMAQRNTQRMQYVGGGPGPQGYMGQPMYGYPPMPTYGQPGMMPMRGPMMGYPSNPNMMQQGVRPRYAPTGQAGGMPGMPMPYGMPQGQMPYGVPPSYPARPGANVGSVRPPAPPPTGRINGGISPVGLPQGLPAGAGAGAQMPARPPPQGYPEYQTPPRLNAQSLARASPGEQKQMLGESLYPLIHEYVPLPH